MLHDVHLSRQRGAPQTPHRYSLHETARWLQPNDPSHVNIQNDKDRETEREYILHHANES